MILAMINGFFLALRIQIGDNRLVQGGHMSPFLILIFIVPSLIIFFLGRYIGKTQYVEVIKNYDEKKNYDKEALSKYVEQLMFLTSVISITACLISFILAWIITAIDFVMIYLIIYAVVTIQYMIRLRFACKKFEIKEN